MKRLLLAAFAFLALAAIPTSALASPTPSPTPSVQAAIGPLNAWSGSSADIYSENPAWCCTNYVYWAESTVTKNWYLSSHNINTVDTVNTCGSCEYTQLANDKAPSDCMTVSGSSPYQIYDYTCKSGRASQNWGVVWNGLTGKDGCREYALFNQYMEQKIPKCNGRWNWVIQANNYDQPSSGLHMNCPTTSGQPDVNQIWSSLNTNIC